MAVVASEVSAARRVVVALAAGVLVGVALAWFVPWQVDTIIAWDVAATVFVVWVWATIHGRDAAGTQAIATREDNSRLAADVVLISASVVSLVGVAMVLLKASESTGPARPATIAEPGPGREGCGVIHLRRRGVFPPPDEIYRGQ